MIQVTVNRMVKCDNCNIKRDRKQYLNLVAISNILPHQSMQEEVKGNGKLEKI